MNQSSPAWQGQTVEGAGEKAEGAGEPTKFAKGHASAAAGGLDSGRRTWQQAAAAVEATGRKPNHLQLRVHQQLKRSATNFGHRFWGRPHSSEETNHVSGISVEKASGWTLFRFGDTRAFE